ncbi:MAG: PIG-L family deacetylase [Candidatus Eremiobacteraeota bacterium]|nr:PIG-L family deacetylase [Candidatus Eremiobacteraeota bacterium]MCW5868996.1 PIG-L family deacetylase [Candidatus Eremiobacteraeota bacterium]
MLRRLLLAALLCAAAGAEPVRKLDILFVGAHPDDDSTATATLARYAAQGKQVGVVTATRGEQGGNLIGPEQGAALGLLRESEERAALNLLGISTIHYLERLDSGFTTSVRLSERNWGRAETLKRLVRLVRYYRPEVLITMSPAPRGHGDHQLIAQLTTEAFFVSPRGGGEGLPAWAPRKLYYTLEYGADGLKPDLRLPTGEFGDLELRALRLYRSQWPPHLLQRSDYESFVLAAARGETDPSTPGPRPAPALELERTPALTRFLRWSRGLGLDLEVLAPATRVCRPGETVRWPLKPKGEVVTRAPAQPGPHPLRLAGLPATLQVVPALTIGPSWSAWQPITSSWEGENRGSADASGRFRLKTAAAELCVEVEVQDDQLVAELPPGENRAHWRTDAVEITLDPSGRSQDTSTTFKLGIIAQNTLGKPMAARDADAHPGPWTGPLRLTRQPGGYRLQTRLPLPPAREFGFNVLIYDKDPGEAPCRLAWSAWETVQGWPELWGRVKR